MKPGHSIYFSQVMLPVHSNNRSIVPFIEHIEEIRGPGDEFAYYGRLHRSVPYYMRPADAPYFASEDQEDLRHYLRGKRRVFVIIADSTSSSLVRQLVRSGGTWSRTLMDNPRYKLFVYEP